MANRAKTHNKLNHIRQLQYLRNRIVMLPTLKEERTKSKNGKV